MSTSERRRDMPVISNSQTSPTFGEVRTFTIPTLEVKGQEFKLLDLTPKTEFSTLQSEYSDSTTNAFQIDETVRDRRGHTKYAQGLMEQEVANKVNEKIKELEAQAKENGYQEGLVIAKEEIQSQLLSSIQHHIEEIKQMANEILGLREKPCEEVHNDMLKTLQMISKWMVYKYIDQDSLSSLMKRAFHEVGTEQNILIKLDKESYANKEEYLNSLIEEFGELKHIRIVCDENQLRKGFQIELDNVLVDASFESQMQRLDLLFEKMREKGNEKLSE